jgi:hypothetical protein
MAKKRVVRKKKASKPTPPLVKKEPAHPQPKAPSSNTIMNSALADLAEGRQPAILPTKAEVLAEWRKWSEKTDVELTPLERKRVRDLGKLRKLVN